MSDQPGMTGLDLFLYEFQGDREVVEIEPTRSPDGNSPFVIVRHGDYVAVLSLMPMNEHLCIDVHAFVGSDPRTSGVFGMTNGRRATLETTGTTSHGWNSASTVSVLIGKQGRACEGCGLRIERSVNWDGWVHGDATPACIQPKEA